MPDVIPKALPMQEAQAFWRNKVQLGPGQYARLSKEAKLRAFAVSGIAKGEELTTVYNAIKRAIDHGISFADFKRDCGNIFARRGWTGKRAWRVDNIFRTNIQTAYSVGAYKRQKEVAAELPYAMYSAINDSRTRPTHRAVNGLIFPLDHPFWDKWWPPNGFRCRCTTIPMSKGMIERRGLKIETEDPTGKPIMVPGETNPRQLLPDYGFDYHPGKAAWGGLDAAPDMGKLRQLPDLPGHADYKLPAARNLKKLPMLPDLLPSLAELKAGGMSNRQAENYYLEQFRQEMGLTVGESQIIAVAGEPLIVSEAFITRRGGGSKITKGNRGPYIPIFKRAIIDPDEIWLTPMRNEQGQYVLRKRQLTFWRDERNPAEADVMGGFCVLDVHRGVASGVTVYDVAGKETDWQGLNKLDDKTKGYRRGILLYRKKK